MLKNTRSTYVCIFLMIGGLLGYSVYLQFYQGFQPCPLCSLQRVAFVLIGFFTLLTTFFFRFHWLRLTLNLLSFLSATLGGILAGRQIWLQYFPPPPSTECSPSLQYMMQVMPMNELLRQIFAGSSECAEKAWEFLYLSMAEWSFIWFVGFALIFVYLMKKSVQ